MIKYLGSKRVLVPVLGAIAGAVEARSAIDLFTGTTRVAQAFKRRGLHVTAVDTATYSEVLAQCYIATDASAIGHQDVLAALQELQDLPPQPGYFTQTFCEDARFFHPKNGARVDAMRQRIEQRYRGTPLHPILLTALMEAADRVDSTTGQQMAYLKQWAPRALGDLALRPPELLPGPGRALRGDALTVAPTLPPAGLAYLDPPYNQHRYFTNYHIWETLVRWDAPATYGVAHKRADARQDHTKSAFNSRRTMPQALRQVIAAVPAQVVVASYNDEAWVTPEQMLTWLRDAGHDDARLVAFDFKRYVGAQIGIFNPAGQKVGRVSHTRNQEYVFVAGPTDQVEAAVAAALDAGARPAGPAAGTTASATAATPAE
ncbi:MAG: DNA adenine methylase [Bifidobacteriaceae bacterium]|nr:DNA adenine methylase [Bifidobacteriaceae bacterium]